jgi:hypothetical protein
MKSKALKSNGLEALRTGLIGLWIKVTKIKCCKLYPDELEFRQHDLYSGRKGEALREFTLWDSGEYQILSERWLKISTANDAEIAYRFTLSGDVLTFIDKSGCRFRYHRAQPHLKK